MIQLAYSSMNSPLSHALKLAAGFAFASLVVACGSSDDNAIGVASDGGAVSDARSGSDGATTGGDGGNGDADGEAGVVIGTNPSRLAVDLGTAGNFVVLAKSGISSVPTSAITGDIGVSPIDATAITGFSMTADATNVFATSAQVTGKIYASNYATPTPANLTTAVDDMQTAFVDAAGRAPDVTELGAGQIGGKTIAAGVYEWSSGLLIPTDVTLSGSATDVWIFQVAQNLSVSSGTHVTLAGGALAKNIFWQVSGSVDLGTTSHFEGVILTQTAIALHTGASVNGRLMAQTAVSIDNGTVVQPAP
jgi:hypothetical protein